MSTIIRLLLVLFLSRIIGSTAVPLIIVEEKESWKWTLFRRHTRHACASYRSNVKSSQFWQHHNKPIELWTPEVTRQKMDYVHNNPVVAGFVLEPHHWKYSSAIDYSGGKGVLEMDFV